MNTRELPGVALVNNSNGYLREKATLNMYNMYNITRKGQTNRTAEVEWVSKPWSLQTLGRTSKRLQKYYIRYLNSVPCFYLAGVLSNTQDNLKEEEIVIWW